jgi:hypothetical protein
MCFCHGKEKLPAFKVCFRAARGHPFEIDSLDDSKRRIGQNIYALCTEFRIHVIVNPPEPFREILLIAFYGIIRHVFGKTFATELTGKNIRNGIEKLADGGGDLGGKADKME